MAPSSKDFILSICLEDRDVFARFDEIPSMNLQDIKETVYTKEKPLRITKGNNSNSIGP